MSTQEKHEEIRSALCDWNKPSKMASIDLEENVKKVAHLINSAKREARGCIDCQKIRCENCERLWQT